MLRTIQVYGRLAHFLGQRTFKAAINSPAEAIRFLVANFPGLDAHMADQHYKVLANETELEVDQIHLPTRRSEPIKIVPVIAGAGAVGRIIAGAALVAAAIFIPGLGLGLSGATVTQIGILGGALVLGGVTELLTPVPKMQPFGATGLESETDPRKSYSFSGIQNTSRQGVPVPIIYGETIVGSIVISAFTNTFQVEA